MSNEANRFTGVSEQAAKRDLDKQRLEALKYLQGAEVGRAQRVKASRSREQFKLGFKRAVRLG